MEAIQKTAKALAKNGFNVTVFKTQKEAKAAALNEIGSASVGVGGSITVSDMKLPQALEAQGNAVHWHWAVPPEQRPGVLVSARNTDVYLTSSNAITEQGQLVNIDGHGNRVANMFYGPPKVIVIAGKNKIVSDINAALIRLKEVARPKNAQRMNLKTPCVATGKCIDCGAPSSICNVTTIIDHLPVNGPTILVYLIEEDLGY